MTAPAAASFMAPLLTRPYQRGAELFQLPIGADLGGFTTIGAYNFSNYTARYGSVPPTPAYILCAKADGPLDATEMVVEHTTGGPPTTVSIQLPARVLAGETFSIPLPSSFTINDRLLRFQQRPVSGLAPGATRWGIIVLLGNTARLLWVLGWEKDQLRAHGRDVKRQRYRAEARGHGLDLLGKDLRVPRFPPAEHSFDPDVISLYHMNDTVANGGIVDDEMKKFGLPGHDGTNSGAVSGVAGKFGSGFRFPGTLASTSITIPDHADFNIAATASFTVEAFIKPDSIDAPDARIVIMKRASESVTPSNSSGWALSVGSFRGVRNNVMASLADGSVEVKMFADLDVADGFFHHVALVVDRLSVRARLYLDGIEVGSARLSGLGTTGTATMGAINNTQPIRIGRVGVALQQYAGTIDEIRLSRVARAEFNPVLGESDERYRRRLGIFEGWTLPTSDVLLSTINSLVQISGQTDSFTLVEDNRESASASSVVRILPATIPSEQSIDADGRLGVSERDAAGAAEDDITFAEIYLLRHNNAAVTYGSEAARRMQAPTLNIFEDLIAIVLAAAPGQAIFVDAAYDPASTTLHRVGRALRLRHQSQSVDQLAVMAYRAGFDYVMNDVAAVEVATAIGEKLNIIIESRTPANTPPDDIDVFVASSVDLHIDPGPLPTGGTYAWTLVPCGPGRGHFEPHPADPATLRTKITSRPHLRVTADAPGTVTVRVEYDLRGKTVFGTLTLRVGIDTLAVTSTIGADGAMGITEDAAVGKPGEIVNPIYLITNNAPGVDYGTNPDNHRMQVGLERLLIRLLELLAPVGGMLFIVRAFDAAGPQLHPAGRALRFRHSILNAGDLAAVAFRAGFGFVSRDASEVYGSVARGERIGIGLLPALTPLGDELVVGNAVQLRARLDPLPPAGTYNWSVDGIAKASGSFDTVTRANPNFAPREPGVVSINVTYIENDLTHALPYSFAIRLKPALDVPATVIPKYEYDLIMNILNYFHPIGVEVDTSTIREHVVEVKANLLNAFPGYTYPDFRG